MSPYCTADHELEQTLNPILFAMTQYFRLPQAGRSRNSQPRSRTARELTGQALSLERLEDRESLLGAIDNLQRDADAAAMDAHHQQALAILTANTCREAFDLSREHPTVRARYGRNLMGQGLLLGRRLVEAGVPLVQVNVGMSEAWDTHGDNFGGLATRLLPPLDQGLGALLQDLLARGLLDDTLVVWMGDMGRTPRINKAAGRDHWSFCYTLVMAGGGVRGGQVYGSSDRGAAYPSSNPVSPADIAATMYYCLGIDPRAHVTDQEGRPLVVSAGNPIQGLLG